MQESLLRALTQNRSQLRTRWQDLLRCERINSPLANPDTLVFLMDYTLDRLLDELRNPRVRRRRQPAERPPCPCGRNPLLAYFRTAEQAIIESLFVFSAGLETVAAEERTTSLEAVKLAIRAIGRREIEAFCAVCQHSCRHGCPTATLASAAVTSETAAPV